MHANAVSQRMTIDKHDMGNLNTYSEIGDEESSIF
jgi:hypothetical protein